MEVTLEMKLASAHRSLRAMFPKARTISVDLETEHHGRGGGLEITWSVYVVREEAGNIQASHQDLATAVANAMLQSATAGKLQQIVQAVQLSPLPPVPHCTQIGMN